MSRWFSRELRCKGFLPVSLYHMIHEKARDSPLPALVVGLLVMMWPILTKGAVSTMYLARLTYSVQYEKLPAMFQTVSLWRQIGVSVVLNWVIGPFVSSLPHLPPDCWLTIEIMLAVAWATLPDLPTYRTGVIMVGLAR